MSEWQTTTIGAIAEIFDGPHATPKRTEAGPWFLNIGSLRGGRLDLSESAHISEADFATWTRRVTPTQGDVLFSYETRLGEAALMPSGLRACLGRRMGLLRPRTGQVDSLFLLYAYLGPAFQEVIRQRTVHGATVDRIPLADMQNWPIAVPPIRQQQTMTAMLGALDGKIALNERIASDARILAQLKFQSAVNDDGVPDSRDLVSVSAFLSRGITPRYTEDPNQLMVLNQKCVRDGRVTLEPARRTQNGPTQDQKLLQANDILVNSTGVGTLGRVARWMGDVPATVDSHVTIVRVDPQKADPVCVGFAMLAAQRLIESLGEGSTGQTELSRARLGALTLTLPNEDTIRQLRPVLDALEARGKAALDESRKLAELRDTLLPKLMLGEIRVRDAERIVEDAT